MIGAAHAGWKGALTGILESTVAAMEKLGADRGGIVAAIGPLIRQPSYEVGSEFVERFLDADAGDVRFFLPGERAGHSMFDLAAYIRMRLENAGVLMIDDIGVDTYADERCYSYRRSVHRNEPDYGRLVHAIALDASSWSGAAGPIIGLRPLRLRLADGVYRGQQNQPRQNIHRHHEVNAVGGAAGPLLDQAVKRWSSRPDRDCPGC